MDLRMHQITYRNATEEIAEYLTLPVPGISEAEYKERLREIGRTYSIISDSHTGRQFEIAIVNESQLAHGAILMPSTMFSSITLNRGNAIELAAHGAMSPNIARVYVAFPGNGRSMNLSRRDRHYLARTGRFTRDGAALDSISALARALEARDIQITSISADIEGGRLGLGIMAALPSDSVTSAYFNGLPGISPLYASYITSMMREDREGQKARTEENIAEEFRVGERTMADAEPYLRNIYEGFTHTTRVVWTYLRALPNMAAYINAFSQYNDLDAAQSHAVLQDMLVALRRQRQVKMTLEFGELSALHSIMQCRRFGGVVTDQLTATAYHGSLQLYVHDGSLDFHTVYPSRRWAAERAALMVQ